MAKYRAVLMVPSIVEFESEGTVANVTEQANRIARGMGKAASAVRKHTYTPTVIEIYREQLPNPQPDPPTNLDIQKELG